MQVELMIFSMTGNGPMRIQRRLSCGFEQGGRFRTGVADPFRSEGLQPEQKRQLWEFANFLHSICR